MTLDEAIEHCQHIARLDNVGPALISECGEQHKQLAEWLMELKRFRQYTYYLATLQNYKRFDLPREHNDNQY